MKEEWTASSKTKKTDTFLMEYVNDQITKLKIEPTESFTIVEYCEHCLIVAADNKQYIYKGKVKKSFSSECSFSFYSINDNCYIFVKYKELYSVYEASNLQHPILQQIKIYNIDSINHHKTIWHSGRVKHQERGTRLYVFNLTNKTNKRLDEKRAQHSVFKDASKYKFKQGYILSSNSIVIDPRTANIKDAFIGSIESHSLQLNKIVSRRANHLYLSIFNPSNKKYEEQEIKLDIKKFQESYLSPDGQFLVLKGASNKYSYFDIEKNEEIRFLSGKFLAFSKEGNLIIEEDQTRTARIYDPATFSDITPPNYHHYRFLSPDGKLYAQTSKGIRFINRLNGDKLTKEQVLSLRKDLDEPTISHFHTKDSKEYKLATEKINKNREIAYFWADKSKLNELNIENYSQITSHRVVKGEYYVEIGIIGTNVVKQIVLPPDTHYYNYAAFSYDNKYVGIVGKPTWGSTRKSLMLLCEISFDEASNSLEIDKRKIYHYARRACWVCGFSKTGYFATYDSIPDTYLLNLDALKLKKIEGKNFLCFSPTGKYLALSEQGYDPLTLGGYGHQESSAVHIAITETCKIVNSFTGHGDKIKNFVAFSEDEKRIMSLSSDGVVIIRELNMVDSAKASKREKSEYISSY